MLKAIKGYYEKAKEKRLPEFASFLITSAFAAYSLVLAVIYNITWNLWICIYYLVSMLLQGLIILTSQISKKKNKPYPYWAFLVYGIAISILVLVMNVPAALMVKNKRPVNIGLIPALEIALFTTIKVIMAVKAFINRKQNNSLLDKQTRTIKYLSVILSVLTLQNTLIYVAGSEDEFITMKPLTAGTTFGLLSLGLVVSILTLIFGSKEHKKENAKAS